MEKTIFAVSDIHGEFQCLKEGLEKAGYDENNPEHLLVSLGDAFDRGSENLEVYKYLKRLSDEGKAIVLKGNHTNFLIEYLEGSSVSPFNYFNNGTKETMADFLGRTSPFESWCMIEKDVFNPTYGDFADWIYEARIEINNEFPELLNWLRERPYYFESEHYIFTHGAIDTEVADWHHPKCSRHRFVDWEALLWDDGSFFGKDIKNTDKSVVIGHFGTATLRKMYDYSTNRNIKGDYDILYRKDKKVIAIDGTTNVSKKVNVLVLKKEKI